MRKIITFALLALFGTLSVQAQDVNPKKAYRQAKRNLSSFELDNSKVDELNEAVNLIMSAAKDEDMKSDAGMWNTMGDIYSAYLELDYKRSLMDEAYKPQFLQEANKAYMAYKEAYKVADKSRDKDDALAGMAGLIQSMSNSGITVLQAGDPMGAYNIFRNVLDIHELLKENEKDSPLNDEEAMNNQLFLAGYAALLAEQYELATPYYMELKENDYDDPSLYEGLFKIKAQDDPDAAAAILEEGRQKYPDDLTLLYAEINAALKNNEIQSLESKLKEAIAKDPENVSLYTTTGSVYDRLFQEMMDSDAEQAAAYFDSAKVYFEKALEVNPDNVDAIYSIGALYYNQAAQGTQELQAMADDLTSEGMKKYDAKKAEVDKIFDEALPYFKRAEKVNPSDRNTLIALKEIFARKNKMDISDEFAKRLEKVEAGGTIDSSYFENN
ncbi:hypothetical protein KUV50_03085 [Membranicola marinus]|uniref:Tetratricopeptide repeat-containing protein n=1 Tax=Membranihabitans marinus TaxID=1227546 RepID=A0A953L7Y3_9BACT|nr:hypothetical protein [Membranihabitans marinus]MBY5957105.1 hypothetical protein [Membranihabitans marinus]